MSDKHDSHAGAKTFRGQSVLAVVGLLLLVALPFIPWLSRGISQRSAANAIKSSGGLASYGKRLLDGADYVKDEKRRGEKSLLADLFGDPFVEQLTQVQLRKPIQNRSVLNSLPKLRHLEILDATGAQFTDEDLRIIADCPTLKKLWVNGGSITAAGLNSIAQLPNLMSLSLEETPVDDVAVAAIVEHSNLKRLYLKNTNITDTGVAQLTVLTGLLGIGLEGTRITDASVQELAKMSSLQEVRLSNTAITDTGTAPLASLPNLQSLFLNNTEVTTAGVSWMKDSQQLEFVELAGTKVNDDVIPVLAAMPKLISVDLRKTSLSRDAVDELRQHVETVQSEFSEIAR